MDLIKHIISRKVLLHSLFWIIMLLVVFTTENWQYEKAFQWSMFAHFVFAFIIFAIVSYFNIYFLVPRYFKKKKYGLYALLLIAAMVLGALLTVGFRTFTSNFVFALNAEKFYHKDHGIYYFVHILFGELMFILATTFFFILEEWIRLQSITIKLKEIENDKTQSELQALKAQINPHFLFNTLNNIYSHSLEKSPKTPEMILKLSSLMSYILYECHEGEVPVSNEIEFVNNYLALEKLRFEDQIDIHLSVSENYTGKKIAPLLFIPFIENAFKHGSSNGKNKKYVEVNIEIERDFIFFNVKNSTDKERAIQQNPKESGIGIENVKKRLALLYPGTSSLAIIDGDDCFEVNLKIADNGN